MSQHDARVSSKGTWDEYYDGRSISVEKARRFEKYFSHYRLGNGENRSLFELGCGGSEFLVAGANLGWQVGGIDYHEDGLSLLKGYFSQADAVQPNLFQADIFDFDWGALHETVDLIASFGFLEHFTNSDEIIKKASAILKPGGLVLSQIPNLFSINAKLMQRYKLDLWNEHVPYDIVEFDRIHVDAGLQPILSAHYAEGFDQYMLTPWEQIEKRLPFLPYKVLRYTMSYLVQPASRLLPKTGQRSYCASIIGVYAKP